MKCVVEVGVGVCWREWGVGGTGWGGAEPAEPGSGENDANWSRKCRFLTLSRARPRPERVGARQ